MEISLNNSKRGAAALKLATAAALMFVASSASAQWQVIDNAANNKLGTASASGNGTGTVNGNLRELYQQQRFSSFDGQDENTNAAPEPNGNEKLTLDKPSATSTVTVEKRCPQPKGNSGMADEQWNLCKEIFNTERAQYNFSLRMYELSTKRQQYLNTLKQQRANLQPHEIGKLQDNTNRILLLMSQMEIDRQQQATYMDAYKARLSYLNNAKATLANHALNGNKDAAPTIGGIITDIAGGLALKGALEIAQSRRKYNF